MLSRAFQISVHFFVVLSKTTTWENQILSFAENLRIRWRIFHFSLNFNAAPTNFFPKIARPLCTRWTSCNNCRFCISIWRFRYCHRRPCLNSLLKSSQRWEKKAVNALQKELKVNSLTCYHFSTVTPCGSVRWGMFRNKQPEMTRGTVTLMLLLTGRLYYRQQIILSFVEFAQSKRRCCRQCWWPSNCEEISDSC